MRTLVPQMDVRYLIWFLHVAPTFDVELLATVSAHRRVHAPFSNEFRITDWFSFVRSLSFHTSDHQKFSPLISATWTNIWIARVCSRRSIKENHILDTIRKHLLLFRYFSWFPPFQNSSGTGLHVRRWFKQINTPSECITVPIITSSTAVLYSKSPSSQRCNVGFLPLQAIMYNKIRHVG